jgi:hypothetical protein
VFAEESEAICFMMLKLCWSKTKANTVFGYIDQQGIQCPDAVSKPAKEDKCIHTIEK